MKKPKFKIGDVVIFKILDIYHQGKISGAYYSGVWIYYFQTSDSRESTVKEEKELTKIT